MKRVADWQIEHFNDSYSGKKKPHHQLHWANAALYIGMTKWAAMANDESYYNWLKGIGDNNDVLDKERFLPAVISGWNAMVSHVTDEGMMGYLQPIGQGPGNAWPDKTEVYGAGAFLSAGSEVYTLFGGQK